MKFRRNFDFVESKQSKSKFRIRHRNRNQNFRKSKQQNCDEIRIKFRRNFDFVKGKKNFRGCFCYTVALTATTKAETLMFRLPAVQKNLHVMLNWTELWHSTFKKSVNCDSALCYTAPSCDFALCYTAPSCDSALCSTARSHLQKWFKPSISVLMWDWLMKKPSVENLERLSFTTIVGGIIACGFIVF
jgi:hypothetical protein